jgi:hypothetical protein
VVRPKDPRRERIVASFTEGFDTANLREAKQLLA